MTDQRDYLAEAKAILTGRGGLLLVENAHLKALQDELNRTVLIALVQNRALIAALLDRGHHKALFSGDQMRDIERQRLDLRVGRDASGAISVEVLVPARTPASVN